MSRSLVEDKWYVPIGTECLTFTGTTLARDLTIYGISLLVNPYLLSNI